MNQQPSLAERLQADLQIQQQQLPVPDGDSSERFDLQAWLYRGDAEQAADFALFDRLRKKVEVARVLYRFYTPALEKGIQGDHLAEAYIRYLTGLMLHRALVQPDLRYLNTVLKIRDGVLAGQPVPAFPELYTQVVDFLLASLGGEVG